MKELIEQALSGLNIPLYYVKRPQSCTYCIVYNYVETPLAGADGEEVLTRYSVVFNLITTSNINRDVELIKKALKESNFKKITINSPTMADNTDFYQVTMQYNKIINSERND